MLVNGRSFAVLRVSFLIPRFLIALAKISGSFYFLLSEEEMKAVILF